jgi:hypothetical protein
MKLNRKSPVRHIIFLPKIKIKEPVNATVMGFNDEMLVNGLNKKGAGIKIQPRLNPISYEKPNSNLQMTSQNILYLRQSCFYKILRKQFNNPGLLSNISDGNR